MCGTCRDVRDELGRALKDGDVAAAINAAAKGTRELARQAGDAVRRQTKPPAVTRNWR